MKKFSMYLTVLVVNMIVSCDPIEPVPAAVRGNYSFPGETQAFEAAFYTDLASMTEDASCSSEGLLKNVQVGNGRSNLTADMNVEISFCVDLESLEYIGATGVFKSESGDEIHIIGAGQIKPTEAPGYDLEFQDIFEIVGGTGRFNGATGTLYTDSYVNMTTNRTDHNWSGYINLIN